MIPLIAVVDPHYVGHESIRDEVGSDYNVAAAIGFSEAQALVAAADMPIVVAPETLEPEAGRLVLARLKAAGHRFIGVLMVDEAAALPRPTPDSGITHVAFRPLRQGEFRRHVDAAAVTRAAIIEAAAEARGLIAALSAVTARLAVLPEVAPGALSAFVGRTRQALQVATRPLELAWLDPVDLLADAARAASDLWSNDLAGGARTVRLVSGTDDGVVGARRARLEGDARALREAFVALVDNAIRHAPGAVVQVTVGVEACRVDERHGWLFTIEDDGGAFGGVAAGLPGQFGLERVRTVVSRHGGSVEFGPGAGGWRVQVWLPENAS